MCVVNGLAVLNKNSGDLAAREQVALGTDLGGYAIMLGGTSGPHLNSFSLVKYLSHGRACALMNPYYMFFFTPAVEERVRKIGNIFKKHGYVDANLELLNDRNLGLVVSEGILSFNRKIGFPTTLAEIDGIDNTVIDKILTAAKDPQLENKLQNMPVPITTDLVDQYMGPILEAAWSGDLGEIILRE